MVHGEPGIGKSRLLEEAARDAAARGMTVLATVGVQSEARLPFAGLHQLLRPVRARAAALPEVQRGALDAAFGLTRDDAAEPFRVAMAALDLVAEVATLWDVAVRVRERVAALATLDPVSQAVLLAVVGRLEAQLWLLRAELAD